MGLSSPICRPSYAPFAGGGPNPNLAGPCHQGPQGSSHRRHVERTDKLETRADKLRRMTQVDAMPCPGHAEHMELTSCALPYDLGSGSLPTKYPTRQQGTS